MKKIAPAANFLETSGESGGLVFNITFEHVKQLGNVFFLLDKKNPAAGEKAREIERLRLIVTDVGVSQSTLEEVFMAASHLQRDNQNIM